MLRVNEERAPKIEEWLEDPIHPAEWREIDHATNEKRANDKAKLDAAWKEFLSHPENLAVLKELAKR